MSRRSSDAKPKRSRNPGKPSVAEREPSTTAKKMKSYRLSPDKIQRARQLLGTPTETATIETALDLVIFRSELITGTAAMFGVELTTPEEMD